MTRTPGLPRCASRTGVLTRYGVHGSLTSPAGLGISLLARAPRGLQRSSRMLLATVQPQSTTTLSSSDSRQDERSKQMASIRLRRIAGFLGGRYCGNCGRALGSEDQVCSSCGSPVPETPTVPNDV